MSVSRRLVLQRSFAAAILPLFAMRGGAVRARAADGPASAPFAPPGTPMVYTRRLERSLGDGAKIVIQRSFAIRFDHESSGFRVDGAQIATEVDMPPSLARLAAIERERREANLFPLLLDAQGRILSGPEYVPDAAIGQAIGVVEKELAKGVFEASEQADIDAVLAAAHRQSESLVAHLPHDLFRPRTLHSEARRTIALPHGEQGLVEVRFAATLDPMGQVLHRAERTILTRLADSERLTRESWSLEALAG